MLLGGNCVNYGILLRENGKYNDALQYLSEAIALLVPINPALGMRTPFLCNGYKERSLTFEKMYRYADSAADLEKVVALATAPEKQLIRISWAFALIRSGQILTATEIVNRLVSDPNISANGLYACGGLFAIASSMATDRDREVYCVRSISLIRQAVAKGWKNFSQLLTDANLNTLRGRTDFWDLIWDIAE